jgi:hypothetical protein
MPKLEISKVHDAYKGAEECPLCVLEEDAETTYLRSFQHSRVMEPNVRVQTNRQGFCAAHLRGLYEGENKLGLSLVLQTRLRHVLPEIGAALDAVLKAAEGRGAKDRVPAAAAPLSALGSSCFICGLLRADRDRYILTILYLWSRDPDFPPIFRASRGFCIPHFAAVIEEAARSMRPDRVRRWLAEAVPLMKGRFAALESELHAFSQLHQAGNDSPGTAAEKSALRRTLQKLAGGSFGSR